MNVFYERNQSPRAARLDDCGRQILTNSDNQAHEDSCTEDCSCKHHVAGISCVSGKSVVGFWFCSWFCEMTLQMTMRFLEPKTRKSACQDHGESHTKKKSEFLTHQLASHWKLASSYRSHRTRRTFRNGSPVLVVRTAFSCFACLK